MWKCTSRTGQRSRVRHLLRRSIRFIVKCDYFNRIVRVFCCGTVSVYREYAANLMHVTVLGSFARVSGNLVGAEGLAEGRNPEKSREPSKTRGKPETQVNLHVLASRTFKKFTQKHVFLHKSRITCSQVVKSITLNSGQRRARSRA